MTENDLRSSQPGTFHWQLLRSSTPAEEQIPPIDDPQVAGLIRISRHRATRKARIVVLRALDAVLRFKHSALGTEHLLLGILYTPDQEVSAVLEQHGFDRIHLCSAFGAELVPGTEPKPEVVPVTSACKKAVGFAEEEASRLHQSQVGSEHLLVGISRDGSGIAGAFLEQRGLTYERLLHSLSSKTDMREAE